MDAHLDKFTNAQYLTKLDMTSAFLQIPIDKSSRNVTAFTVQGRGQYRFKRMPLGMSNSTSTYQEMMDNLIRSLPPGAQDHIFAYIDDLCVVSETFEEHLYWLEILLKAINQANLELNPSKSHFCCGEIKYLGYIVDSKGLHVDPDKVKAIKDFPAPTNPKQMRRFLGMVGWYAKFLTSLSNDKEILCALLKKKAKWIWTRKHEEKFEKIKRDLISAPVLIRPDFSKSFFLHCDASDYAIGVVLAQKVGDDEHPVVFINRLLTSGERKFTTTEKECLAVL